MHAGLRKMQTANAVPHDRRARLDADRARRAWIVVRQLAVERGDDVVVAEHEVIPRVGHRVFEIEHHAGRAGVEHLDDELGVVGGSGHLIALICAPRRQLDAPVGRRGFGLAEDTSADRRRARARAARSRVRQSVAARRKRSCSGRKNSANPAGRSRSIAKPAGATFMLSRHASFCRFVELLGFGRAVQRRGRRLALR